MANYPYKGHGQVTWTIQILVDTNHISETAKARVVKFDTRVGYVKSQYKDDKPPLKRAWLGSCDPL